MAAQEDLPEYYVRRLLDNNFDPQFLSGLNVQIRTKPVGWVERFVQDHQGHMAMSTILGQINKKTPSSLSEIESDEEYELVKCFRSLYNVEKAAAETLHNFKIIDSLCRSLFSRRLATRRSVTESLTYVVHKGNTNMVLQAFDNSLNDSKFQTRFGPWIRAIRQMFEGRGIMGSLVGASHEFKASGVSAENALIDYGQTTLIFMNQILSPRNNPDIERRILCRHQLETARLQDLFNQLKGIGSEKLDLEIENYIDGKMQDYEQSQLRQVIHSPDDIVDVAAVLKDKVQNTESETQVLGV